MGLPDADILSYTNKAVTMLHIAVVSLPDLYMQHLLQQQELQLIDEDDFANMFFLIFIVLTLMLMFVIRF